MGAVARALGSSAPAVHGPRATSQCTLSSDDCMTISTGKSRIHDHNGEAKATQIDDLWMQRTPRASSSAVVAQAGATDTEHAQAAAMVVAKVKQGTIVVDIDNKVEVETDSGEDENMEGEQRSHFEKAIDDSLAARVQSLTQADNEQM